MDAYLMLKQQIAAPGLLVLMSLNDIGRTKSDVLEQATWLRSAGIEIVIVHLMILSFITSSQRFPSPYSMIVCRLTLL